jgi:hypothetical protein
MGKPAYNRGNITCFFGEMLWIWRDGGGTGFLLLLFSALQCYLHHVSAHVVVSTVSFVFCMLNTFFHSRGCPKYIMSKDLNPQAIPQDPKYILPKKVVAFMMSCGWNLFNFLSWLGFQRLLKHKSLSLHCPTLFLTIHGSCNCIRVPTWHCGTDAPIQKQASQNPGC